MSARKPNAPLSERMLRRASSPGLLQRWWAAVRWPGVARYTALRETANWRDAWVSILLLALVEAVSVAWIIYGPAAGKGISSLPVGPKLSLPQTPLLPLAALVGGVAEVFGFSGVLYLAARALGGHGRYLTQTYLITLFWAPLMLASDVTQLLPLDPVGSAAGVVFRLYALALCPLALASAHAFSVKRAFITMLIVICAGLAVGLLAVALAAPRLA